MQQRKQIIQTEHSARLRVSRPSTGLSKVSPPPTQVKFKVKPMSKKKTSNDRCNSKKEVMNTSRIKIKQQSLASTVIHSRNASRENKTQTNWMIKSDDPQVIKITKVQSKRNVTKASPVLSNRNSKTNLFSLKVPISK